MSATEVTISHQLESSRQWVPTLLVVVAEHAGHTPGEGGAGRGVSGEGAVSDADPATRAVDVGDQPSCSRERDSRVGRGHGRAVGVAQGLAVQHGSRVVPPLGADKGSQAVYLEHNTSRLRRGFKRA